MRLRAAAFATALCVGVSAAASAATPRTSIVDLDGIRGYVRSDAAVPIAGIELFVRAGLSRQSGTQSGIAALVAECLLHQPVDASTNSGQAVPLADAIATRGGSLTYSVSSQYVRFYLEAQPEVLTTLTPLVTRAFASPAFTAAVLTDARAALGDRIAENERDPRLVGMEMLRGSYYRGGAGMPAYGTAASLASFGPDAVKDFFTRWYLRGDAIVASVGRTGPATDAASRAIVGALPAGSAPTTPLATRPYAAQPKRLVTRRDVYAPYVVLGFAAPALGDRDFAAALVVRSLVAEVFESSNVQTGPSVFRPVGSVYGYDTRPAQLVVWINGARVDPSVGLAAIDGVLKSAATKPLAPGVLNRVKETAHGRWALENLSLDERAFAVGNAVALGLDADADDAVDAAIARVTAADVRRVAKQYFQRFDVALVLPRQSGSGG